MHLTNIVQSKSIVFPSYVFVPNMIRIIWLNNSDMRYRDHEQASIQYKQTNSEYYHQKYLLFIYYLARAIFLSQKYKGISKFIKEKISRPAF